MLVDWFDDDTFDDVLGDAEAASADAWSDDEHAFVVRLRASAPIAALLRWINQGSSG